MAYGLDDVVLGSLAWSWETREGRRGTCLELDEQRENPAAHHGHGVLEAKRSVVGSVLGKRGCSGRGLSASRRCERSSGVCASAWYRSCAVLGGEVVVVRFVAVW